MGPVRLAGLVPHPPSTIGKVLRRHGCSRLPRPAQVEAGCRERRYDERACGRAPARRHREARGASGSRAESASSAEQAGRPHKNRAVRSAGGPRSRRRPLASRLRRAARKAQDAGWLCPLPLERALAWYRGAGILAASRCSLTTPRPPLAEAWIGGDRRLQIERRCTRDLPARAQTAKQKLIATLLRGSAYARSYPPARCGRRALGRYLRWYNRRRPHSSLGAQPPISRVSHLLWSRQLGALLQGNLTEVTGVRYGLRQRSWLTAWISRSVRATSYSCFQCG